MSKELTDKVELLCGVHCMGTMPYKKRELKFAVVGLMIAGILCLHYLTPPHLHYLHVFYRMLFYIPLIMGAFWFGLGGALVVSVTVSLCYLPHVIMRWQGFSLDDFTGLLEGALYVAVGLLLGFLVKRENEKHEALLRAESLAAVGRAVSEVAHDMKTPLMAIGGFANRVKKNLEAGDPNLDKLEVIVRETGRLENMVKDMLDFGRPLELQRKEADLNDVLRETMIVANPIAEKCGVRLEDDLDPAIPSASIDSAKLKQVFLNLIANAIQASPSNRKVSVKAHCLSKHIEIRIVDQGCGIKESDREKVFQPFFSTKKSGTGLGLPIAKKIVEAHGGDVFFSTNTDGGVTFTVRMPVAGPSGAKEH